MAKDDMGPLPKDQEAKEGGLTKVYGNRDSSIKGEKEGHLDEKR
ncbi:MAG: hypothetical protein WKF84_07625 [Pyrinomonadaceae bacterium]